MDYVCITLIRKCVVRYAWARTEPVKLFSNEKLILFGRETSEFSFCEELFFGEMFSKSEAGIFVFNDLMQKMQKNYKSFGTTMFTNSKNYSNKTHQSSNRPSIRVVHTTQSTSASGRRSDDVLPCPTWLSRPPARTGRTRAGRKPSRRSSRYTAPAAPAGWSGKLSTQMLCHRLKLTDILLQRRGVITVNCGNSNDHDKKEDTDVSQATRLT